jgi:hypothetical protein
MVRTSRASEVNWWAPTPKSRWTQKTAAYAALTLSFIFGITVTAMKFQGVALNS